MAYKQPSSGPFKMMGSSPAKQKTNPKISLGMGKEADANLSKKLNPGPKNFNTKGGKSSTPGYKTTKSANKGLPKNFNTVGTSKAGKLAKVAKKVVGKAGKFLGGKTLGIAGMMMATSSKADQPKGKAKKKGSYTDDFTKLRK